jgi:anti-sigma regulatory factor (Ser/Thr protein kinase)
VIQTRSFSSDPESVGAARRFATETLNQIHRDLLDAIELMVSELATNCVRHANSAFDLSIMRRRGEVRVEVTDRAEGIPMMRSPAPDEPTGRGLQIVNLLSEHWGIERRATAGKTVWFSVSAPGVSCTAEPARR